MLLFVVVLKCSRIYFIFFTTLQDGASLLAPSVHPMPLREHCLASTNYNRECTLIAKNNFLVAKEKKGGGGGGWGKGG